LIILANAKLLPSQKHGIVRIVASFQQRFQGVSENNYLLRMCLHRAVGTISEARFDQNYFCYLRDSYGTLTSLRFFRLLDDKT
jgi:hypothetical protein